MKVLRGTLTFVLGMIIGIILFVLAIGGTVLILATQTTVGNLQSSITGGNDVISPDSELYNKTILEAVKGIIGDVQNFDALSLKVLYEHYGIELLNGISGIDFTTKNFYSVPIPELVNDLSIVVNSFTLRDISKIAGVDFESYGLPVLTDNLDNNVSTAVDNILGSLNGDLSLRAVTESFGLDLGLKDNLMLSTLQDVTLSSFGSVITALRLNTLLDTDTDVFVLNGDTEYFVAADRFEEVSADDLKNKNYVAPLGVETYFAGGIDSDGNGVTDTMDMRELRYVKKTVVKDGEESEKFVVDNSCYSESFNADENDKTFYRHIEYERSNAVGEESSIMSYVNHIDKVSGTDYALVQNGFISLSETTSDDQTVWGISGTPDADSKLEELDTPAAKSYRRIHVGTSAMMLQNIAFMTVSELKDADKMLDNMLVADLIKVDDSSAKLLRSLVARKTKIKELGSAAGELPLGEIIDITSDSYVQSANGSYVRIADENSYTLFDENTPSDLIRYKKNSDGTFSQSANGDFVHAVYYELFNPAEHGNMQRYNRVSNENASSTLLQRFAGSNMNELANSFSNLLLSDVMEIDGDTYAVATAEYISAHPEERFFRYNSEMRIFVSADKEYMSAHPDETYFCITKSGQSVSLLKKLVFVKVDDMADAMGTVLDDMLMSELLDIYNDNAIELKSAQSSHWTQDGEYLLEYTEGSPFCGEDENGKFVYAYDSRGNYAKSNFIFGFIPETEVNGYSETDDIKYIFYAYKSYAALWEELGKDATAFKNKSEELAARGNLYYYDNEENAYKRNNVLCTYMLGYSKTTVSTTGDTQITFPYRDKVFFRVKSDSTVEDNVSVFKGKMYTLKNEVEMPEYGLYVKDSFRGFIEYDSEDPALADMPLGTFKKSTNSAQNELEYFILRDEIPFYASTLKNYDFIVSTDIRYERRAVEYVYVLDEDGDYVYVGEQYVEYDSSIHDANEPRFTRKLGYIASANETYYSISSGEKVSEFSPQEISRFIRKKSVPVLRTLARGTLGQMSDIISDAKVGDIIEADSGNLFAVDEIRNAKITELDEVFSSVLAKMTIGDLVAWSNVSDIDNSVRLALESVSVNSLLQSLEYDAASGTFVVNMLKLYGYKD